MKKIFCIPIRFLSFSLIVSAFFLGSGTLSAAAEVQSEAEARVFLVPIEGTIDLGLASFVERVVAMASAKDTILLEVTTFGGRVDAAVRIKDALLHTKAKTIAFVEGRAISAGALISLACDSIYMTPGSSIGAATPVEQGEDGKMEATSEKVVSYMRAEMRATAEAKGRRADIAEAMVDASIAIEDVTPKGKLLTLTAKRAVELQIAQGLSDSLTQTLDAAGLSNSERVQMKVTWGEKLARLLSEPTFSGMLMTIGMLGLMLELYTAGFGASGAIGLTCLLLFFFGQYSASVAGWEELILFIAGLLLLVLEIFVMPGFGIAGVFGIALVLASFVFGLIDLNLPFSLSWELGFVQEAFTAVALSMLIALLGMVFFGLFVAKRLPKIPGLRWLVLGQATAKEEGYQSSTLALEKYVGMQGKALTILRPAGIVVIDDRRLDAMSNREFIDEGEDVEVIEARGQEVIVKKVELGKDS